jgi:oligopeptide transport system substrate-binding protein
VSANEQWWDDPEQLHSFEERMRAIRVPRRQMLKIMAAAGGAAAVAACGGGGNNKSSGNTSNSATNSAAAPAATGTVAPNGAANVPNAGSSSGTLAAVQTFNDYANFEPLSFDFNKDLYCMGDPMVLAGLAYMDPDYNVQPDMAEKWSTDSTGAVYTYNMRASKWSNGDPVTANDFEYSFKRQLNPATGASYAAFLYDIKNAKPYNTKQITDESQVGVKAIDPQTLQITLEGPRAYWPILTAYAAALPANKKAVQQFGDKWTEAANMVSNGPFKLTAWDHNKSWTVEKNENYWNASQLKLTKVNVPIVATEQTLITYQNNEIDVDLAGQLGDLKNLQSNATYSKQLFKFSEVGTWYLVPSATIPPFDNVNVRLAVAHAIDRDKIVNDVLQGVFGKVAYTFDPPGTPGYNPNTYDQYTKFDPTTAKNMLKGTPYEGGKNWPKITMTQRKESDAAAAAGDAIIQMLHDNLGMTIDHVIGEPKATYDEMYQGKIQLMWIRWYMDYPDPNDNEYLVFYGKTTSGHRQTWHDDTYDNLVTQAAGEQDPAKRTQLYQQADQILAQQAAAVFVYYGYRYGLIKPYVQGLPKNKAGEFVPDFNIFIRMRQYLSITQH